MSDALDTSDMPIAWRTMPLAAILGVQRYRFVSLIERLAIPWHVSPRSKAA
jgi:ABC-type nitrate/sulfonate/bicarbonate transport system permease component